jgi:hypothetical protein
LLLLSNKHLSRPAHFGRGAPFRLIEALLSLNFAQIPTS